MIGQDDVGEWPVLDLGGEVGALIVHLAAMPPTGELEAQPADKRGGRFHTGVHLRNVAGRPVPVALFPVVTQGTYEILDEAGRTLATVVVAGGEVAQLELS